MAPVTLLGTMKDFQTLLAEMERRGTHLIMDGVFNHAGDQFDSVMNYKLAFARNDLYLEPTRTNFDYELGRRA